MKIKKSFFTPASIIYLIDTLNPNELQTGEAKRNTLLDEITQKHDHTTTKKYIILKKCKNKESLKNIFLSIENECNHQTNLPWIFIDGHGDKDKGLALPSGDFFDWNALNKHLKQISIKTNGNLTVFACFCHSFQAIKHINHNQETAEQNDYKNCLPTPFYYGYTSNISAGKIQEESNTIIKSIIKQGVPEIKKTNMKLHSEYDHFEAWILPLIKKLLNPEENQNNFTKLSKKNLRKGIIKIHTDKYKKTSGSREAANRILDPKIIIIELIKEFMYNTERREILIKELLSLFSEANPRRSQI